MDISLCFADNHDKLHARLLKKEHKINDTWTASGNIMVKTLQNVISQLKVKEDIQKY